ncbi:hypothetical protein KBC86_04905 [Candidatus Gracilibacteria bacterium]|nr:hypothetical protein [Candidatus Gracilibacteria bacterium]
MSELENEAFLAKKSGILEVLKGLVGHWEMAEGLINLIESEYATPEIIDGVELILEEAIKTVKDSTVQDQLQAGIDMIREIQEAEKKEQIQEKSTEELDILKNFI